MANRTRGERTQPKNPHRLTVKQHIHSRAALARFGDEKGLVGAIRRPHTKLIKLAPEDPLFCADRVWSQKAEAFFFKRIEDAFQREVERALLLGTVFDHEAVTEYFSIWQIRSHLASNPPGDMVLEGGDTFTQDEEERLEKKGVLFTRRAGIPSRLCAEIDAKAQHHANMKVHRGTRWGVLHGPGRGLVCPDCPRTPWIPLNGGVLLLAGYANQPITYALVAKLNVAAFREARSLVLGHPDDLRDHLQANPNPWVP